MKIEATEGSIDVFSQNCSSDGDEVYLTVTDFQMEDAEQGFRRRSPKRCVWRPTFLFDWLRSHDWITARNEPYSERVKQNVLRPRVSNFEHPERGPSITVTAHVTPKGLYRIYQSMLEEGLVTRNDQLEMSFNA